MMVKLLSITQILFSRGKIFTKCLFAVWNQDKRDLKDQKKTLGQKRTFDAKRNKRRETRELRRGRAADFRP